MDTTNLTAAKIMPAVLFPLPVHHGVVVFGLTLVALIAAAMLYKMFFSADAKREIF